MREEDFKVVLSEWMVRRLPLFIEREVKIPSDIDLIVTIVRPRQSGKTLDCFSPLKSYLTEFLKKTLFTLTSNTNG
jgi:predicted AAA+ superfamily ATPase